jgi:TolA-binding protein
LTLKHTNSESNSNSESGGEESKVARGLDSVSDREPMSLLHLRAELMAANARISELELELLRQSEDAFSVKRDLVARISELELELLRQSEDASAAAAAVAEKVCALEKGLGAKDDKLQTALRAAALRETDLRYASNCSRSLFPVYQVPFPSILGLF